MWFKTIWNENVKTAKTVEILMPSDCSQSTKSQKYHKNYLIDLLGQEYCELVNVPECLQKGINKFN